jgi:glycosyltransferase involved in cell wall biosynthesis
VIDILLSTYNGEAFLREQLDSILNQTYSDFKILIRDDGSADSTVNIIKDYVFKYPLKIVCINIPAPRPSSTLSTCPLPYDEGGLERGRGYNAGFYYDNKNNSKKHLGFNLSYNELLNCSTADYIMFSDQDDVWLPEKVEISFKKIKELEKEFQGKPILVHSDLTVVNKDLKIINGSFFRHIGINPYENSLNRLIMQNTVTGCTMLINKNLAALAKPISDGVYFYDYWFALVAKMFGAIGVINKPLLLYRQHDSNVIGAGANSLRKLVKKLNIINDLYRQGCLLYKRYYDYSGHKNDTNDTNDTNDKNDKNGKNGYEGNDGDYGYGGIKNGIKNEAQIILRNFIELGSANPLKRLYVIFKYRFFRQGLLRNMGFLLFLVFFIDLKSGI